MFKKISFIVVCSLVFSFLSFVKPAAAAASIGLSPSSGQTSSNFTISGSEFTASLGVTVTWDGNSLGGGTALESGNISLAKTVPSDASVGSHTVTVTSASIGKLDKKTRWAWIKKVFAVYQQQPPSASATFTVVASGGSTPSDTPSNQNPSSTPSSDTNTTTPSSGSSSTSTSTSTVDKSKSKIETDKTEAVANGQDKITISLTLLDSKGKVITGLKPVIIISDSDNTLSSTEFKDNKYVATLTSTKAEDKDISAKIDKVELDKVKVKFTAATTANTAATASPTTTTSTTSKCPAWWAFWQSSWWSCWWWIVLILLVLIVAGYMYYRYRKQHSQNNTEKTN